MSRLASLIEMRDFFEITVAEFARNWKRMSSEERTFFKEEIGKVVEKAEYFAYSD